MAGVDITVRDILTHEGGREQQLIEAATEDGSVTVAKILVRPHPVDPAAYAAFLWITCRAEAAADEVNAYILPRYADVDSSDLPDILRAIALDFALHRIYGGDPDSDLGQRRAAGLRYLRDVAAGKIDLDVPATATAERPPAQVTGGQREFSDADWAAY